jgi:hypothetical protein
MHDYVIHKELFTIMNTQNKIADGYREGGSLELSILHG